MLNIISHKVVEKILSRVDGVRYDKEVYVYGVELVITTLAGLSSILIISGLFSDLILGLIFITCFVPLRLFTGGYHASTYGKCFVLSNVTFTLILYINEIANKNIGRKEWLVIFIFASIYIAMRAPEINMHQEISQYKRERSKRIVKKILVIEAVWIIFLGMMKEELMSMSVLSVCLVSAFMLVANNPFKKGVIEV